MSRLLIAYATWAGSTRGVAEAIGEEFEAAGHAVDVLPAAEVQSVEGYDGVVLGAAVHMGRLHRQARRFVRRHRRGLADTPLAAFVVCASMSDPTEENLAQAHSYAAKICALMPGTEAQDVGLFAGALLTDTPEFARQGPFLRMISEAMAKDAVEKGRQDTRDWEAIRAWARQLAPRLKVQS